MYDVYKDIKQILSDELDLPVYYEGNQQSDLQVPCITYSVMTDAALYDGDTMRYSDYTIRITIWATNLEELVTNSILVDRPLYRNGIKRGSSNDMFINSHLMKKIITYSCKAREVV